MTRSSRTMCFAVVWLLLGTGHVLAQQTEVDANIVRRGPVESPGVEAEVGSFESSSGVDTADARVAVASPSATSSEAPGPAAPSGPVPVALVPHTCAPVFGSGGVSLAYNFSDAGAGDCLSFSAPAPVAAPEPAPDRRGRDRRERGPDIGALISLAANRAIALAPTPELRIAPDGVGLTGLPSYFWLAEPPTSITATASAGGVTVIAQASPVQFVWTFGDGSQNVTHTAGRPWTRDRPGSIAHTYETRGRYPVAVEVIYHARWSVDDAAWSDLGFFSTADSRTYPVRQIVAVLIKPE
jgi:PKD domain-containing protein